MKINVGVFFGGRSVEHEISVLSALQAINAFDKNKYSVTPIYISKQGKWYSGDALLEVDGYRDIVTLQKSCNEVYMMPEYGDNKLYLKKKPIFGKAHMASIDVILPVLHGTNGEDGVFQGFVELTGIPYASCNTLASSNGMDKITMKMILRESSIPVLDYVWFTDKEWHKNQTDVISKIETKIGYPVIIKPANLGSSVGISHATNREDLITAIDTAEKFSTRLIAEHMVMELKEINCSVLGNYDKCETSVCEEPLRSGEILSYEDKYLGGGKASKGMRSTQRQIPADLPVEMSERIRALAAATFQALSCEGVSRVDFIIDRSNGEVYVNEINTIPGSLSFYLWDATGLPFDQLMDRLIMLALKRSREAALKTVSYEQNIFNMRGSKVGLGSK